MSPAQGWGLVGGGGGGGGGGGVWGGGVVGGVFGGGLFGLGVGGDASKKRPRVKKRVAGRTIVSDVTTWGKKAAWHRLEDKVAVIASKEENQERPMRRFDRSRTSCRARKRREGNLLSLSPPERGGRLSGNKKKGETI